MTTLTREQVECLRWHMSRANHGRGRVERVKKSLLKLGLLKLTWTSMKCWVITITEDGKDEVGKSLGWAKEWSEASNK